MPKGRALAAARPPAANGGKASLTRGASAQKMLRATSTASMKTSASARTMHKSPSTASMKRAASAHFRELHKSPSAVGLKRSTSAVFKASEHQRQPLKRVNSKDLFLSDDEIEAVSVDEDHVEVMLSDDFAEVKVTLPNQSTLTKRISMRLLTKERFEEAIRDPERLARAIAIAKKQHCEEDLQCLSAVLQWERVYPSARATEAEKILKMFIAAGAPREVCIESSLRNQLLEQDPSKENFFAPLKHEMISELRLMPQIAQALLNT